MFSQVSGFKVDGVYASKGRPQSNVFNRFRFQDLKSWRAISLRFLKKYLKGGNNNDETKRRQDNKKANRNAIFPKKIQSLSGKESDK